MSLNSNQISTVNKVLGTNSLCSAVVRLYTTTGDEWKYTGIIGVAAISKKNGFSTISLVDLENQTEFFSEELYYNFNYQTPKPYFHHFEVGDCVAGFSFADDSEATNFSNQVNNNKPSKTPQINTPPPNTPPQINTPPPQQNLTPIQQPPKSNSNPQPPSSQDKKNNNKKGGGGGFFSKLFGGGTKKEEVVHEISGPTNFRHESHIGWDPVNGFDIRNIPPAWKELFKKAGVKKSDLQDKETAKLVMETIVENIGGPPENTPPPPTMTMTGNTPPPPPMNNSGGNDNVPPPPMPPPPPTFDGPPPPKFDGPPPPKPPPPMQTNNNNNGGGGTTAPLSFAEQLKMKQTSGLKTVEKIENLPQLPEDTGTLANALASALKNRRGAIEEERDSDDNNSGDEWSD